MISREAPPYPSRALARDIEGWVDVQFNIDINGNTSNIVIVESTPKGTFDAAAIKSVKKWKFQPAISIESGSPVEVAVKPTRVHFRIE